MHGHHGGQLVRVKGQSREGHVGQEMRHPLLREHGRELVLAVDRVQCGDRIQEHFMGENKDRIQTRVRKLFPRG